MFVEKSTYEIVHNLIFILYDEVECNYKFVFLICLYQVLSGYLSPRRLSLNTYKVVLCSTIFPNRTKHGNRPIFSMDFGEIVCILADLGNRNTGGHWILSFWLISNGNFEMIGRKSEFELCLICRLRNFSRGASVTGS